MVMQCGVKRKRSYLDSEHQKSLLELSVHKLQEEQAKYGIEPRLLRFVLVNNALKTLQLHMSKYEADDEFCLFDYEDSFLANTFSHGFLSSPVSPPTPVKVARFEGNLFSSHSPLVNSSSSSCILSGVNIDLDNDEVFGLSPPLSPFPLPPPSSTPSHLNTNDNNKEDPPLLGNKRTSSSMLENDIGKEEDGESDFNHNSNDESFCSFKSKRQKLSNSLSSRPLSLSPITKEKDSSLSPPSSSSSTTTIINSSSNEDRPSSPTDPSSPSSSSLSPIDFSNVDVSLYDFDARAALTLPPVAMTPRSSAPSSLSISSCAMETFIKPLVDERETICSNNNNNTTIEVTHCQANGTSSSLADNYKTSNSPLTVPVHKTEGTSDVDNIDDIDRIVSLLIT